MEGRTARLCLLAPLAALLVSAPVFASEGGLEAVFDEAKELFELVEYDRAAALFLEVAESAEATDDQRREAFYLRAVCLAGLDRMDEARDAFVAVMDLDPAFELPPMVSPKVREAHEAAVAAIAARPPPEPQVAAADPPPSSSAPRGRGGPPSMRTWALVAGAGGAATLGAGAWVGNEVRAGARRYREDPGSFANQSEAHDFADHVERRARTANALFIGGAVLTAGAVGLFLADDGGTRDGGPTDPRLSALAWPGGAAVTAGFRW